MFAFPSWLFEGGVRVPAFVMGPGIPSQRQFDSYFHTSDWLPTLYAAAGGDVTHLGSLDGINQWRALTGDLEIGSRSEILLNVKSDEYGLIDGDYKLVACWGSCYGNKKYQDGWHYYLVSGYTQTNVSGKKIVAHFYPRFHIHTIIVSTIYMVPFKSYKTSCKIYSA